MPKKPAKKPKGTRSQGNKCQPPPLQPNPAVADAKHNNRLDCVPQQTDGFPPVLRDFGSVGRVILKLWHELQTDDAEKARFAARKFIERTTWKRQRDTDAPDRKLRHKRKLYDEHWESQFDRHKTVTPLVLGGAVLRADLRDALEEAAIRLPWLAKLPSPENLRIGRKAIKEYLELLGADVDSVQTQAASSARDSSENRVIIACGDRSYYIGQNQPLTVTVREDTVLQSFVSQPSMDHATLVSKAGYTDAARILRGLRTKYKHAFSRAIHCPGKKGRGGYHVSIRTQAQTIGKALTKR